MNSSSKSKRLTLRWYSVPAIPLFLLCSLGIGCSLANSDPPADSPFGDNDLRSMLDFAAASDLARAPRDMAMATDGGRPFPSSTLLINEVFPHGADVNTDPDFIELYNGGSGQVNLRGYKVKDHGTAWAVLPDDAVIPAGAYYIVNCDGMASGALPGAHVAFKLGGSGDEVHLASPDDTEIDRAQWGSASIDIPKGQSLGRIPDFTGGFSLLSKPTRGKPNQ